MNGRMAKIATWAALPTLFTALLAAGCASSGTGLPHSWIQAGSDWTTFIQWTAASGGHVSGQLEGVTLDGQSTKSQSAAFTGTISNGSISLTFPEGLGAITTLTGTVTSDQLKLNGSASSGPQTYDFKPGGVALFHKEASRLDQAAAAAQSAASAAAARTALDQTVTSANTAVGSALSGAAGDIQDLNSALEELPGDFTQFASDWSQMQTDWQTEQQDNSDGECSDGQVGADAGQVGADNGDIGADQGSLDATEAEVQSDLDQIQADSTTLTGAWNALTEAVDQDRRGAVSAAYTHDQVEQELSAITTATTNTNAKVAAANTEGNQYVQEAAALNNEGASYANSCS
jgi:hypothetical protein